jgi:secondary thiamine-phosphate synthase enzyme
MYELKVVSKKRNEMIDITTDVQRLIAEQEIQNGYVIIYIPHATAGITINEGADPSVQKDIIETLNRIVPESHNYLHSEGNSDAHIKASILGSSVTVFIENSELVLGTWQHIFFYEADGPRSRKVYLEIFKNKN